jgi:glycosyltransferase involved in cell wall biosynthesis
MLLNERMMAEAEASGFPRSQLVWMPNPVETDKFQPYSRQAALDWRIRHGLPVDAKLAIYTGRLSPEKGIRELMRGIAEAAEHHPDCMLVLVGDGPMRAELETLAREIDPAGSRFYFAGRAPLSEIPCWLGAADVFALTSPNEGFSCSLVEAMSVGLPSVVSDIDANVQLVTNDVHGLAVPWNQPSAIGVALSRLFANPASRGQLGAAARKRAVENYSIEKVVARYEVLFGHVLNSPKRTHQSTTKKRNTST